MIGDNHLEFYVEKPTAVTSSLIRNKYHNQLLGSAETIVDRSKGGRNKQT